jgi:hypothetical protein
LGRTDLKYSREAKFSKVPFVWFSSAR